MRFVAIIAICFAVGCSSTVIQPCGPRMCEQIIQMTGTNISTYEADSLACNITTRRHKDILSTKAKLYMSKQQEHRFSVQMRCVMCTEIPTKNKKKCQTLVGHIVCAIIKDNRSCVFTSNMPREDTQGIIYNYHCGKQSGLTRTQRQMSCVLLSRLVKKNDVITQPDKLSFKQVEPGMTMLIQNIKLYECKKEQKVCNVPMRNAVFDNPGVQLVKQIIVEAPEDVNCISEYGYTTLIYTAISGHIDIFDLLLGFGVDITADDMKSLLSFACKNSYGQLHIVRILVELGFDVEKRGPQGRTPLSIAAKVGGEEVFAYLLGRECEVTALDNSMNSILHLACIGKTKGRLSILNQSIGSIDIEGRNKFGETPLAVCVSKGALEMVKYLVERGCNMTALDNKNNTILQRACAILLPYRDDRILDMIRYIVSQNVVRLDYKNFKGETALTIAERLNKRDIVKILTSL